MLFHLKGKNGKFHKGPQHLYTHRSLASAAPNQEKKKEVDKMTLTSKLPSKRMGKKSVRIRGSTTSHSTLKDPSSGREERKKKSPVSEGLSYIEPVATVTYIFLFSSPLFSFKKNVFPHAHTHKYHEPMRSSSLHN